MPNGGRVPLESFVMQPTQERPPLESFLAPQETPPPTSSMGAGDYAADIAKSGGIGLAQGVIGLAGTSGDVRELAARGAGYLTGISPEAISPYLRHVPLLGGPTSQQIQSAAESVTGPFYKPQTTAGEYARTLGEFIPGAALGPEMSAARVARTAIPAALASETAGQVTKGTAAEPYARAGGALFGGIAGVRSADQAAANAATQALRGDIEAGTKGLYQAVETAATAVPVSKLDASNLATQMRNELNRAGARQFNAPGAHAAVDDLVAGTKDAYDLVKWREAMKNDLYTSQKGGDRLAAPVLTAAVDKAIDAIVPTGVGALKTADREYSIQKLIEALDKRFQKVESQTASTASGQNLGNKYRQALSSLQGNERAMRGFTEAERTQIQQVIDGTTPTNALRTVSNLLGGGGGLGRLVTLGVGGHLLGGPGGGAAAVGAGMLARSLYNRTVANQARQLQNAVASRSTFNQGLPLIPPPAYRQVPRALPFAIPQLNAPPTGGYYGSLVPAPSDRQ